MSLSFERVPLAQVPWEELDHRPDRTVHQTREWTSFLAATQRAEPVVLRARRDGEPVAWFTGAVARRAGVRILGSPMRGWATSHMGFNVDPGVEDLDLVELTGALAAHASGALGCWHLEVMDRRFADGWRPP